MPLATPTPRSQGPFPLGRLRASFQPNARAPSVRHSRKPVEVYGLFLHLADGGDILQAQFHRIHADFLGQAHPSSVPAPNCPAESPERERPDSGRHGYTPESLAMCTFGHLYKSPT